MPGADDIPPMDRLDDETSAVSLSRVFASLSDSAEGQVSVGDVRDALGDRGFAALLLLFAAINLVPVPPGATMILALPLILVSGQLVLGFSTPWLPASVSRRSVTAARFRKGCGKLIPWLEWLERFVRPRLWPMPDAIADRAVGLVALALSLAVFVPAPFLNWIPALAIALLALALSERDGAFFFAGVALGAVALIVIGTVIGTAGAIASAMLAGGF